VKRLLGGGAGACLLVVPLVSVALTPHAVARRTTSPATLAAAAYHRMTQGERIGQLFMVGEPSTGTTASQRSTLRGQRVGNVILDNNSSSGAAVTAGRVSPIRTAATQTKVAPFISTDQEGGEVQRLTGPGFSTMPSALTQGTWSTSKLQSSAKKWGGQLVSAGVNLDLAPVGDVVPAKNASSNQPIGRYDREFGHSPKPVASHVVAFLRGMRGGGEATTVKHFPGLGRATGNTDVDGNVTDPTTRHDSYLRPFRSAISAGVPFVMVSSATYPAIDKRNKACFSKTVITRMLRGDPDLGFRGVVISDSLTTPPMNQMTPGTRAKRFLSAGGDMILVTEDSPVPAMISAIKSEAASSSSFAAIVKAAVMKILLAKANAGLITS
jgi:beta-N-acetylhexosaminidase